MTNDELLRERVARLRCRAGGETYAMVGGVVEARIKHRRPRGTNNSAVNASRAILAILLYRGPNLRKIAD
jgi:hypothetical protein